jgi:hypothetical protein
MEAAWVRMESMSFMRQPDMQKTMLAEAATQGLAPALI